MVRAIPRGKRSYLPDYIAFLAMLTVAASVATGLVLQFGMTLPMAGAVALSALAAAMTGHILMRRNDSIALLEAELADREARHRSGGLPPGAMGAGGEADDAPVPPLGDYRPAMTAPDLTAPDLAAPDMAASDMIEPDLSLPQDEEELIEPDGESLARLQKVIAKPQPVSGSKAHLGTRKGDDVGKIIKRLANDIGAGRRVREGVAIDRVLSPKPITAADFEIAQSNAGFAGSESAPAPATPASNRAPTAAAAPPVTAPAPTAAVAHAPTPAAASAPAPSQPKWEVPDGVSFPAAGPPHASPAAAPPAPSEPTSAEPEPENATDKLAAVANALAGESVDVFLEPIHGLDDRLPRHYEVTIRLALADGEVLDDEAYSEAARGTGLLPLIDAVKVSHTKRVGLQLLRRGQSGALISAINGESVSGSEFGDDLATIMGPDKVMAGRLVLSFTQLDVRGFAPAQWASIDRLAAIGFRFALSDITDMDIDFDMLAKRGFAFAKLDAEVFRAGLQASVTVIPPSDVCRHIASAGLTLVVNRLVTERDVAEVLGFGALFGQGMLFGGPRPVKADVIREPAMVQGPPAPAPR